MLRKDHPAIAIAFGVGLLAVVIAAALAPNTGAVPAQTSCPYGVCQSSQPSSFLWTGILIGLIAIAAVLGAIVLYRRRRAPPPSGPVEPWAGAGGAGAGAVAAAAPAPPPPSPPVGAPYVETPEDVGHPIPPVPAPAAPPAGEGAEPDIDSLMRELDKISGEILKRSTPKTPPEGSSEDGANASQ